MNEIEAKYPELYSDVYCGMDIMPGWQTIVQELSENLHELIKSTGIKIKVVQIKEKFGTLNFYTHNDYEVGPEWAYNAADALISKAQQLSFCACSQCGEYGIKRSTDWIQVLCEKHYHEHCELHNLIPEPDYPVNLNDLLILMHEYDEENSTKMSLRIFSDGSGSIGIGNTAETEFSFLDVEEAFQWLLSEDRRFDNG